MPPGWTVHSEPLQRTFRAPLLSRACFLVFCSWIAYVLVPFFLAYATPNFWVKQLTTYEQPTTQYASTALLGLVPAGAGAWSTNSDYNALLASQGTLADCSFTVVPTDTNGDGRNDVYDVTLTVHSYSPTSASSGMGIQGLQLAVEFTVEFTSTIVEQLRGVVYVAASSPSAGARVYVDGAMRFVQSGGPLRYQATSPRTTYNTAALGLGASGPVNSFETVLRPYLDRNETVLFEPWATVWSPGPAEVFTAVVRVHVPTMSVRYRPSFWELAKYAWVQYVAVWLLVYLVLGSIRAWILRNQLLPSRVSWDYVPAVKRD